MTQLELGIAGEVCDKCGKRIDGDSVTVTKHTNTGDITCHFHTVEEAHAFYVERQARFDLDALRRSEGVF